MNLTPQGFKAAEARAYELGFSIGRQLAAAGIERAESGGNPYVRPHLRNAWKRGYNAGRADYDSRPQPVAPRCIDAGPHLFTNWMEDQPSCHRCGITTDRLNPSALR